MTFAGAEKFWKIYTTLPCFYYKISIFNSSLDSTYDNVHFSMHFGSVLLKPC